VKAAISDKDRVLGRRGKRRPIAWSDTERLIRRPHRGAMPVEDRVSRLSPEPKPVRDVVTGPPWELATRKGGGR
jgi:hypothetical protein